MNFVAQVEDQLRDLGAEARKTHPGVKEASERAILHLRSLQTQYVAAVRRAGASKSPSPNISSPTTKESHPTTALFRSHDVLRPFLLALNHPDASPTLTNGAMEAIQLLLRGDAIKSTDGIHIATGLARQAKKCNHSSTRGKLGSGAVSGALGLFRGGNDRTMMLNQRASKEDQSIAFKVLQTMTMLVDSRSMELTSGVLGQCFLGCLVLGAGEYDQDMKEGQQHAVGKGGNVGRAALATMNQILSILFERARDIMLDNPITSEDVVVEHDESLILKVALKTLTDLCAVVHNHVEDQVGQLSGPFAVTMKENLVPSSIVCLSLINMIFKQRCIDIFRVCQHFFENSNNSEERSEGTISNIQFAVRSIVQTSQLVLLLLQQQEQKQSSVASNSLDFCYFYFATSLGSTILTNYLTPPSLQFYEKLDAIQRQLSDGVNSQLVSKTALRIVALLIGFVTEATDAYHKSDFEDGYTFNQTERESLHVARNNGAVDTMMDDSTTNRRRPMDNDGTTKEATPDSIVPNDQLWRTFLSLEVIYCLVCSHLVQMVLLDSCRNDVRANDNADDSGRDLASTILAITKATCDLATISASNRERILHVVLIAHEDKTTVGEPSSAAATLAKKFSDAQTGCSGDVPICDTGLATWLSFKCVLALVQSLKNTIVSNNREKDESTQIIARRVLSESFAPSVSVLQHFIKRMSGSHIVVSQTLSAYEDLAYVSMVLDSIEENIRRHAILTSLCKLCLPSWGKNRAHAQLKESNINSLWVLLRIIHQQFDNIYDEWHTILSTLDQLAVLSVKSSKLHNSYYTKACDIAEAFARLPRFTTCLSDRTLSYVVTALISLSGAVSLAPLVKQMSETSWQSSESIDHSMGKDDNFNSRESITGKLIDFAGRSLGFGGGSTQIATPNATLQRSHSVDIASPQCWKIYSDDLREVSCMMMMAMKISTPRPTIRKLPLSLLLLCVIVEANSYRLEVVEDALAFHLCDIIAKSTVPEYRTFAMEILIHFIQVSMSGPLQKSATSHNQAISSPIKDENGKPLDIIPLQQSPKAATNNTSTKSGVHILKILCKTIESTQQPEIAETGLNALHTVLEGVCNNLSGGNLVDIIKTLSTLSGFIPSESGLEEDDVDRSPKSWVNVSSKSFQILKLILDDFLEPNESESMELPADSAKEQEAIMNCCVAFGKSRHDVNTSLTATGMLWTLADQDPKEATLDLVLSKLSYLALDDRPELRNCAVNTLISCVVGRGNQFTNDQWDRVYNQTIFGIMKNISEAINGSEKKESKTTDKDKSQRYKVAVHHSRDSATKQWSSTLVLILRGMEKVLRLFFSQLLASTASEKNGGDEKSPWFVFTWTEILRFSLESATLSGGRETLEIRLAGIELIALCAQLSCASGMLASANSARVGTNMQVVGGALRSVRAATLPDEYSQRIALVPLEPEVEEWRKHLFNLAFASLVTDFRVHLQSSHDSSEISDHYMIHTVSTQVLNKLTGELLKLYECCKNDEMKPEYCELCLEIFAEDDGSKESRYINLILTMLEKTPHESSRFLNQVQRGVMTLLQSMASNSSLRALKALTSLSGDRIFVRTKALSSDSVNDKAEDGEGEVFELEAAKTIANAFGSDDMSDEVRVVVMCSVLLQYLKLYDNQDILDGNASPLKASEARYDFFISVIDSGVEALAHLDVKSNIDSEVLDTIWDRVLATVTAILMPTPLNRHEAYIYHSKLFLNIVAMVLLHIPLRKYAKAESMLERGAHRAIEVAFECNTAATVADAPKVISGAVDVFLACFMGLCQNMPSSPSVQTLTNQILGEIESTTNGVTPPLLARTQQNFALAVLESLKASSSDEMLIGLFPMLCRLTNVENDSLRRAAGAILGSINISDAILRERRRVEEAERKAQEIEEENNALLEEVEYLQAENEELHRQLAVFSESLDFT